MPKLFTPSRPKIRVGMQLVSFDFETFNAHRRRVASIAQLKAHLVILSIVQALLPKRGALAQFDFLFAFGDLVEPLPLQNQVQRVHLR
jgi:hypothetical protein